MPKVLIVDDNAFLRQVLGKLLVQEGYGCGEAGTGRQATAAGVAAGVLVNRR